MNEIYLNFTAVLQIMIFFVIILDIFRQISLLLLEYEFIKYNNKIIFNV